MASHLPLASHIQNQSIRTRDGFLIQLGKAEGHVPGFLFLYVSHRLQGDSWEI